MVFHSLSAVKGWRGDRECEPVVDIHLHQCPVVPPALPPAWGNKRDETGVALCPALHVVAVDEQRVLARNLHYKEAPK
jgi:hypothetical protein